MPTFNKLKDFKNGWILGDFLPSIIRTKDFEIAVHDYPAGYESDGHHHKIATEINVVLSGKCYVGASPMCSGDIFIFKPLEKSFVFFINDTKLLIIKTPSVPSDKHYM